MQAVIGMQLTGLMLNRCDSVLGRQSQSSIMLDEKYNQTESRSWIHPPEAIFFNLASHDDGTNPPLPTVFLEFNNGTNGGDGEQAAACVIRLRHMPCTNDKSGRNCQLVPSFYSRSLSSPDTY